ncbi:MAG TPA: hypothetical protein VL309_10910 [Vicinamibacterales bacterium]|jgi:hypothetical protein|nr:hypothetical protein [Vicinamibacterales bacterium]
MGTWVYVRGGHSLEVRRWERDVGGGLIVVERGQRTAQWFEDVSAMYDAQSRLESYLLETGWSLREFFPDRRMGRDRRLQTRASERRRAARR